MSGRYGTRRGELALAAGIVPALLGPVAWGLEIRDASSPEVGEFRRVWAVHGEAEMNPFFEPDAEDFSGIGWPFPEEWHRQYALISPRHFLGAAHYQPEIGWNVRFLGTDGVRRDYQIEAVDQVTNDEGEEVDLFVGTLERTDEAVRPFAVWESTAELLGREVLVFGKAAEAMPVVLDGVAGPGDRGATWLAYFEFDPEGGDPTDVRYESGDSGSPTFVMSGDEPALCGVASTVEDGEGITRSFMALVPKYLDEIDARMAPLGYHLTRSSPPGGAEIEMRLTADRHWVTGEAGRAKLMVGNPDAIARHNLRVRVSATEAPSRVSGAGWVTSRLESGEWECRRGGLAAGGRSMLRVEWSEVSGEAMRVGLRARADGLETTVVSEPLPAGARAADSESGEGGNDTDGTGETE